jgi:hypothetical protein
MLQAKWRAVAWISVVVSTCRLRRQALVRHDHDVQFDNPPWRQDFFDLAFAWFLCAQGDGKKPSLYG